MWSQLRRRRPASGPVTCRPLGLTISQCKPANFRPSEPMMSRYSARWAAVISPGVSARVKGAISIPVYPALRIALQASAKGHLSKASLQMEWRNSMNYQCNCNAWASIRAATIRERLPHTRLRFVRLEHAHGLTLRYLRNSVQFHVAHTWPLVIHDKVVLNSYMGRPAPNTEEP